MLVSWPSPITPLANCAVLTCITPPLNPLIPVAKQRKKESKLTPEQIKERKRELEEEAKEFEEEMLEKVRIRASPFVYCRAAHH